MAEDTLNVGDVLRLRNIRHYMTDGKSWVEIKAAKGKVIVVQVLGIEPQTPADDSQCIDPRKVLDQLGWEPKKEDHENPEKEE